MKKKKKNKGIKEKSKTKSVKRSITSSSLGVIHKMMHVEKVLLSIPTKREIYGVGASGEPRRRGNVLA